MLRGLYSAASGLISQQRRHDTVTNNISNIETAGYKQNTTALRSFNEMLLQMTGVESTGNNIIGTWTGAVLGEESLTYHSQGDITQTNNANDFAIMSNISVDGLNFDQSGKAISQNGDVVFQPQAYFTVQNAAGEVKYTRGGQFSVDSQGNLVTNNGDRVLNTNNEPIVLPAGVSINDLTLTADRRLVTSNGEDTGIQLLISQIDNPNGLVREGNGTFTLVEGTAEAIADDAQVEVRQGYIELSNVDMTQASVDLMAAARAYEANQKMVQYFDQTLQKTANEIGRI
ncbi:MAG: flagellar hook-basal body protein [Candidatus Pristimantibacillus lignocellulolyticus]|uniref:Flagellar hook-basal body protein n=1 Tax=Candidatus Pristimantibacillus lignocellulolyticus TaxID=2994561 RepID=A0A9J6ZIM2_9BACL|nr:MAG: flagellar hook-basal body protein [Candidatus Pristimantibacillus lignocellulolyticus]